MQTIKTMIEGKELTIEICSKCGQAFVSYGNCKPRKTKSKCCPDCKEVLKQKITTYKRKQRQMQPITKVLKRGVRDGLL